MGKPGIYDLAGGPFLTVSLPPPAHPTHKHVANPLATANLPLVPEHATGPYTAWL